MCSVGWGSSSSCFTVTSPMLGLIQLIARSRASLSGLPRPASRRPGSAPATATRNSWLRLSRSSLRKLCSTTAILRREDQRARSRNRHPDREVQSVGWSLGHLQAVPLIFPTRCPENLRERGGSPANSRWRPTGLRYLQRNCRAQPTHRRLARLAGGVTPSTGEHPRLSGTLLPTRSRHLFEPSRQRSWLKPDDRVQLAHIEYPRSHTRWLRGLP